MYFMQSVYVPSSFNPRARVGRDMILLMSSFARIFSFNPRARVGRDHSFSFPPYTINSFNPRARVGRDPLWGVPPEMWAGFNPRARVGRDIPEEARGER